MKGRGGPVVSPSRVHPSTEETILREDVVQELLARLERGESVESIARELGINRRTVKRWRQRGAWRRQARRRRRQSVRIVRRRRGLTSHRLRRPLAPAMAQGPRS